jgi:hypothetical protein
LPYDARLAQPKIRQVKAFQNPWMLSAPRVFHQPPAAMMNLFVLLSLCQPIVKMIAYLYENLLGLKLNKTLLNVKLVKVLLLEQFWRC